MRRAWMWPLVVIAAACARPQIDPPAGTTVAYRLRADAKPISSRRPYEDALRFAQLRFFHGYDALVIAPNAGLATPSRVALRDRQAVFGGRLGSAQVLPPASAIGKFVIFLPPLDGDGEVVTRPAAWQLHLEPYARAAAIGVASLDETPRSLADALARGDQFEAAVVAAPLPPVILFPLGPALTLFARSGTLPRIGESGDLVSANAAWERRPLAR